MEYKTYKLSTCFSLIENGAIIKQRKEAKGFPITRIETLSHGKFNRDKLGHADIFDTTPYKRYILEDKDLIMSHINSRAFLGRTVLYRKKGNEQIIHGMNVLRIKTNEQFLDPVFASYLFKTSHFKKAIDSIRKDAINQSSINIFDICNIQISLPSITEQRKISHALQLIDKKIETNHLINDNLEAMAKQLYDYWFVQFDFPNEEGKPYKSSGGAMVWNDKLKREIPKEWMASNYTDLFTIGNGQTMPQNEGLVPAYGGNGIVKMVEISNYPACIIIGRVGANCGSIHYSKVPCWVSDNAISICSKNDDWQPFLFYSLKLYNLSKNKGGSSQPLITHEALKHLYFPMSEKHINQFCHIVNELQDLIYSNQQEILKLTKQRDELLPLLMNGQATVNYHLSDN
ncbi:restriction endonuclease subunit S [Segatella copri]|uniref:restriction endonuclease subunit S n=2 Tax=Segatella copri TaxID=165179 RepID=UPI001292A9D5|nr:restriction endonuclease subunit S [Segatella copri]MQN17512.1 hypothetical protein [Segatella copri]